MSHAGGKLAHEFAIRKLAKLLDDVFVVEGDQHIVACPAAVPSASRRVVTSDHPEDSPLRASPAAQEKLLVFDSRIRAAQFRGYFLSRGFAGLDEVQVDFLHGSRAAICAGWSAQRQHEATLAREARRDQRDTDSCVRKAAAHSFSGGLERLAADPEFRRHGDPPLPLYEGRAPVGIRG